MRCSFVPRSQFMYLSDEFNAKYEMETPFTPDILFSSFFTEAVCAAASLLMQPTIILSLLYPYSEL